MNHLKLMLYLADVCGNVQGELNFLSGICCVSSIGWCLTFIAMLAEDEEEEKRWRIWRKVGYFLIPFALVVNLLSSVIPSKNTVYAMAAIDVGQDLAKTPTASKAVAALNAWLVKQTNEEKK
jgi:hypothetical protein